MRVMHACPIALSRSVTGDDRKRLEGRRMIAEAKGFEMPFVKWTFWCKSEGWFVKEKLFGLQKACALREKRLGQFIIHLMI